MCPTNKCLHVQYLQPMWELYLFITSELFNKSESHVAAWPSQQNGNKRMMQKCMDPSEDPMKQFQAWIDEGPDKVADCLTETDTVYTWNKN